MKVLAALLPSLGVAFLFYLAVKAMVEGDRRERAAQAELDRVERERRAALSHEREVDPPV
jgi:threonine/homoserine/homoserine lactone efflux protein